MNESECPSSEIFLLTVGMIMIPNSPVKKEKTNGRAVRTSVVLPADLSRFALERAHAEHCGNLSAYLRGLLLCARRNHLRALKPSNPHET